MTAIRTWTYGIVAWGALAASATAAPLSWFGSQASLTAWYANQVNSAGNIYAPAASNTVSNIPATWSAPAAPVITGTPALGIAEISPRPVPASAVAPTSRPAQISGGSAPTPVPPPAPVPPPPPTPVVERANAFVNFGSGPYADSSTLTVGSPGPWYDSGAVTRAFGGVPDAGQRADFVQSVMSNVERSFELSGVNLKLTNDPQAPADHTMSVVSGASYGGNPDAIGITTIGGDGFSFIDKLSYANSPDQLAWAVAHNISHELMHALGVANHPDETGAYLDSAVANWGMLTDPNAQFSPTATAMMRSATSGVSAGELGLELLSDHDHADEALGVVSLELLATPVPEPSTIAIWTLSGLLAGFSIRRRFADK